MSSTGPGLSAGDQGGSGEVRVLPADGDSTSSTQGGDGMGSNSKTLSSSANDTGTACGPSRKF